MADVIFSLDQAQKKLTLVNEDYVIVRGDNNEGGDISSNVIIQILVFYNESPQTYTIPDIFNSTANTIDGSFTSLRLLFTDVDGTIRSVATTAGSTVDTSTEEVTELEFDDETQTYIEKTIGYNAIYRISFPITREMTKKAREMQIAFCNDMGPSGDAWYSLPTTLTISDTLFDPSIQTKYA